MEIIFNTGLDSNLLLVTNWPSFLARDFRYWLIYLKEPWYEWDLEQLYIIERNVQACVLEVDPDEWDPSIGISSQNISYWFGYYYPNEYKVFNWPGLESITYNQGLEDYTHELDVMVAGLKIS